MLPFIHKQPWPVAWEKFSPYELWLMNSLDRLLSVTSHVASRLGLAVYLLKLDQTRMYRSCLTTVRWRATPINAKLVRQSAQCHLKDMPQEVLMFQQKKTTLLPFWQSVYAFQNSMCLCDQIINHNSHSKYGLLKKLTAKVTSKRHY